MAGQLLNKRGLMKLMSDTELKKIQPRLPQCAAVDSSGTRCKATATYSGIYNGESYSAKIKSVKVKLCEKHAKIAGWPVGAHAADD
jgi:hypothetical protein